ncbi:hypothetical protein F11_13940 [Rhodospirillum rubrum F11]|nr:hypothetical protein F11_13940 [Rhodospirillum rubrum F11]MBK5955184.1 hypothetical protein [Rhodospirillum rubrum]HAP98898.1 hypothetical protein [Rhodospirillum rubrum]HCF19231.1 hypothetical protein [Rhodospirillum rubrum]
MEGDGDDHFRFHPVARTQAGWWLFLFQGVPLLEKDDWLRRNVPKDVGRNAFQLAPLVAAKIKGAEPVAASASRAHQG